MYQLSSIRPIQMLSGLEPGKDIRISYTGLRPDEKLYEELLALKENSQASTHGKIFRARVREYNHRDFSRFESLYGVAT